MDLHMVRRVVSPHSDVPLYQQVAAVLRARIHDGTLAPGSELNSEPDLCHEFDVGRRTIRDALAILRSEGLVITRRGYRARVRELPAITQVRAPAGTAVAARMPAPEERQRLGLPVGVPVLVVGDEVYPADRYTVVLEQ